MVERLDPPLEIEDASQSREILSAWVTDDMQTVVFDGPVWDDPAAWGIILADIVRHVANIYRTESDLTYESARSRILAGLTAEIQAQDGQAE